MKKFYQLSPAERLAVLVREGSLSETDATSLAACAPIPADQAASLIENQIGQFPLPIGVVRDLVVNGKTYQVPVVTEEPSVVAAASNGARISGLNGGVQAVTMPHLLAGEIVFDGVYDLPAAVDQVQARRAELLQVAASAHPSIVARGGGIKTIKAQAVAGRWLKVAVQVDPQAAMGANIVNTILEALGQTMGGWFKTAPLSAILTNQSRQVTIARVDLAVHTLATQGDNGAAIAERIAALSDFAEADPARAVTANKGVMNGVTGAVLASGNDTRAVEAACHAFAARGETYQPLTTWTLAGTQLSGELTLPLPVGTVGGAVAALPAAQLNQRLAGYADVATMQQVIAAVGLVQNLAAMRALVGPGIQAGHMALQAHALAIAAGATGAEIAALAPQLHGVDLATAKQLLATWREHHHADTQALADNNDDGGNS